MEAPAGALWRCVVCGYIHQGDAPPEVCPVCGARREYFERLEAGEARGRPPRGASHPGTSFRARRRIR
jgi:ABC-type ATPase with predicted acetyltransferase domain